MTPAAKITKDDVIEFIKNMPLIELTALIKELEEVFGVSAAQPMPMMQMMPGIPETEAVAEAEQTKFDVVITDFGDKKIPVIKTIRELADLGLKECKDLVDNLPGTVMGGVSRGEADDALKQLEEVGATIEIK
jgi:large subunit ribosomal protein L7/L12